MTNCRECGGTGLVWVRFNYGDVEMECGLCSATLEDLPCAECGQAPCVEGL